MLLLRNISVLEFILSDAYFYLPFNKVNYYKIRKSVEKFEAVYKNYYIIFIEKHFLICIYVSKILFLAFIYMNQK